MTAKNKIIAFLAAAAVGAIAVSAYFVFIKKEDAAKIELKKDEPAKVEQTESADATDLFSNLTALNIEDCESLKDRDKDYCLYIMAGKNEDKEMCEKIIDQLIKEKCNELFVYKEIIKSGDADKCSGLVYSSDICYRNIFSEWDDPKECGKFSEKTNKICSDFISDKKNYSKNDVHSCEMINNETLKDDCVKNISSIPKDTDSDGILDIQEGLYGTDPQKSDTDNDGLSDLDELSKYFTKPNNPDTDGDGYKDGDEVKNGYNPNGTGRLAQ